MPAESSLQKPDTPLSPPDYRAGVVALGKLLGLTDAAFQKVFGLDAFTLVAIEGSVKYREVSDRLFEVFSLNPNEALAKSESLAVRKLIALLSSGNSKLEFEAATEILNRLRGKPINTTHVVAQTVTSSATFEELEAQAKASEARLKTLLAKREKLKGTPTPSTVVEAEIVCQT